MHFNIWLSLIVLCSLISGYYTQKLHYVGDDEDDDAIVKPTDPGIKDTDGYCIYEEKYEKISIINYFVRQFSLSFIFLIYLSLENND